jgi:hypothetical protein
VIDFGDIGPHVLWATSETSSHRSHLDAKLTRNYTYLESIGRQHGLITRRGVARGRGATDAAGSGEPWADGFARLERRPGASSASVSDTTRSIHVWQNHERRVLSVR